MSEASQLDVALPENPFSTRFTRPGAIPFVFDRNATADSLAAKFDSGGRRAAVVGPHGSGKSTLLAALLPALEASADYTVLHTLHDAERRMPRGFANRIGARSVLIVDGYEQLSFWGRREVRRAVERRGAGLLVTAHTATPGLPTLYETRPTVELAQALVERLARESLAQTIAPRELQQLFAGHDGDLRELFFGLYDLYESRR